jgi:hypothetical protein
LSQKRNFRLVKIGAQHFVRDEHRAIRFFPIRHLEPFVWLRDDNVAVVANFDSKVRWGYS